MMPCPALGWRTEGALHRAYPAPDLLARFRAAASRIEGTVAGQHLDVEGRMQVSD